ncbi:MAG: hypothetical protein WAT93_09355 [Pontixanthobacter sp.]
MKMDEAREILAQMGIKLTKRQMQRAAEKDASGRRKLPFFVDPIDKKLKIEKGDLVRIYRQLQIDARNNLRD